MNTSKESRFSLQPRRWYACEIIGDEFDEDKCSYSPILVHEATALQTGQRTFRLHFYHANYPEGVRDKICTLQTIERGKSFILTRSVDHDPARYLLIYEVTRDWIARHFPQSRVDADDIQQWLDESA